MLVYLQMIETEEDRDKFLYIYHNYQKTMTYAAGKYLKSHHDVEDAVQTAFTSIADRIKTVRSENERELKAFVITIAKNAAINILKKNKRFIPVDEEWETYADDSYQPGISGLDELIETLPENYQEVIYLRYVCGYNTREIGDFLGIKQDSVQKRLKYAKAKLKERIEAQKRWEEMHI